ncbi:Nramp family divalent metal transporter [Streptomyces sp. NPDC006339]|uniref:Nramp family divalent metal transporter n=1 Tax=Streptomyces sp. NPDC006339 TaxID=3156755 RepID=UPI0033B923A7
MRHKGESVGEAARPRTPGAPSPLLLLGPAFVAAVAYVDPGNVATNVTSGGRYAYLLVWVVVVANVIAMLVQYLAAKVTIATGATLAELCRTRFRRPVALGLWAQAELVAVATDLAELIGGAVALGLLFDMPLILGGAVTGLVSWIVLALQQRGGYQRFQAVIAGMLLVVVGGFCYSAIVSGPDLGALAAGVVPRLAGTDTLLLAVGILGATVMPHAIYLHGALVRDRHGAALRDPARRRSLVSATRLDIVIAMGLAGLVNLSMLVAAAATLTPKDAESLQGAYDGFARELGTPLAVIFALALLASGFASTAVGNYAGAVIFEGFLGRRTSVMVRRGVTLVPAFAVLATGVEPGFALVLSQVVLSFGIPFALWPLAGFARRADLMGELVNRRITTVAAYGATVVITVLNLALIALVVVG